VGAGPDFFNEEWDTNACKVSSSLPEVSHRSPKGQQAMAMAMICPEPEKGGRGKKTTGNVIETTKFSRSRLDQARAVLRHSPDKKGQGTGRKRALAKPPRLKKNCGKTVAEAEGETSCLSHLSRTNQDGSNTVQAVPQSKWQVNSSRKNPNARG
jgi:hypothetical protein